MPGRSFQWIFLGFALILVFGIYLVSREAAVLQQEVFARLENRFGFTTNAVKLQFGNRSIESFSVAPEKSSLLYEAGFREGDIVISHTKQKFFRLLYEKKGSTEKIEIVRESAGFLNKEHEPETIYLRIPN